MKVEVTDQNDQKKRLEFEIPQDVIEKELEKTYRQINSTAKVKGFRQGKVPINILKKLFWTQIEAEVIKGLLPDYYGQALKESALAPIGEPEFDDLILKEGQPLVVRATLEIKPVIEPKDYIGLEAEYQKVQATDQDVDRMLIRLRENNAQFEVVEGQPVQEGDMVLVDLEGTVEGRPLQYGKYKSTPMQVKEGNIADEFSSSLVGLNKGARKRIETSLPADFPHRELAGKRGTFEVHIEEIKGKHLPDLDDEFARDLGEYENLDGLKSAIREQIQSSLERQAENLFKEKLIKALIEKNPFDPPSVMIESSLDRMMANLEDQLRRGGLPVGNQNWDRTKVREELRPRARREANLFIILEGIAQKEGLSVSDEEVEERLLRIAYQSGQDLSDIKEKAKANGSYENIRSSLLMEKAMNFVKNKANRIEVPEGEGITRELAEDDTIEDNI